MGGWRLSFLKLSPIVGLLKLKSWLLRYWDYLSTVTENMDKNFPGTSRVLGVSFCVGMWYNGSIGKEVSSWRLIGSS